MRDGGGSGRQNVGAWLVKSNQSSATSVRLAASALAQCETVAEDEEDVCVVSQSSVRGRRNGWRLTIISFHLFRFPALPYQPAASSVIRHKHTIATIRGCAEARGERNVLFV